jgi:hypothetical protein
MVAPPVRFDPVHRRGPQTACSNNRMNAVTSNTSGRDVRRLIPAIAVVPIVRELSRYRQGLVVGKSWAACWFDGGRQPRHRRDFECGPSFRGPSRESPVDAEHGWHHD